MSMYGLLEIIQQQQEQIEQLRGQMPPKPRWATVTGVDPLRIRMDTELGPAEQPLDVTPVNLAGPLSEGDRVSVQQVGRQLHVIGVSGGGGDSGWVDLELILTTPRPGWVPQVRKIGNRVFTRDWHFQPFVSSGNVEFARLPEGFEPSGMEKRCTGFQTTQEKKLNFWISGTESSTRRGIFMQSVVGFTNQSNHFSVLVDTWLTD